MDHLNIYLGDEFRPHYYRAGDRFDPGSRDYDFHTFPEKVGWELNDSTFELTKKGEFNSSGILNFNQFLQSWLFFGLLATVLRDPEWNHDDFVSRKSGRIHTGDLARYLEKWEERESKDKTKRGRIARTIRMIQAEVALAKAHKVVLKYCSLDEKDLKGKKKEGPDTVDSDLGLSLMVLGETLTNAKAKIVERVGFNVRGWHGDANEGWGTPACVIKRMEDIGWCKRTVHMLEGQLRSHATSLLSVYKAHGEATLVGHETCTQDECKAKSTEDDGKTYKTKHHPKCLVHNDPDSQECYLIGPTIDGENGVAQMIKKGHIPLLEYKKIPNEERWEVVAQPYQPYQDYATISHVWADGYGNPITNKIWKCQLDFFRSLLNRTIPEKMPSLRCSLFWIDTLVIPVEKKHVDRRKEAIEQINKVFTNAKYTIVVDNALTTMSSGENYEGTAMKILASGWMRRLWTLQEAYLSRRLLFAFKEHDVRNLDDLEEMYPQARHILTSNIPTTARNYFHNLLGNDRKARINEVPTANNYALLASIWRAAQWRIGRREHETLALATMLNLDYGDRPSFSRGMLAPDGTQTGKRPEHDLEGMMKDLWLLLDETCPGSIPSGIIFLPGNKMSIQGFRWAPKTWMSGQKVDYPDPLSTMVSAAKLDKEKGLLVQYPGFLLHAQDPVSILGTMQQPIRFPVDSTLLECYEVEHADDSDIGKGTILERANDLAIILCRPKPRELAEIALLVEIKKKILQRGVGAHGSSMIYEVFIIRRVKIKRLTGPDQFSQWMGYVHQANDEDDRFICGEVLDSDQRWYVDGYPSPSSLPAPALSTIDEQPGEEALTTSAAETRWSTPNPSFFPSSWTTPFEALFDRYSSKKGEGSGSNQSWDTRNGSNPGSVGAGPKRAWTTRT